MAAALQRLRDERKRTMDRQTYDVFTGSGEFIGSEDATTAENALSAFRAARPRYQWAQLTARLAYEVPADPASLTDCDSCQ